MDATTVILLIVFAVAGLAVGYAMARTMISKKQALEKADVEKLRADAERLRADAEAEAGRLLKEAQVQAKEDVLKIKREAEEEVSERKGELRSREKRLLQREHQIDKKKELVDLKEIEFLEKEKDLKSSEDRLQERRKEIEELVKEQINVLEKISGMSSTEAKEHLLKSFEDEIRQEAARMFRRVESETRELADKKAREIIALAVARYAGDYVADRTVSVVALPNEEMKGRIIGREGRNIRAIEAATGIDIIIDDTPEAVLLSGFNPVRREVARVALERLVLDGRIHPARIEEIVTKVEKEIDTTIREAGEQATFDVGVYGIHPELVKLLGKLKFRTSYAQNVLQHSIEVAFLCGIMAAELGINVKKAKRAGLLHDIGKAVDHEIEGSHAIIGANLAKKYGESREVVHAIAAHHEDVKPETILAVLVQAADALSGARPGARREMLESYVNRLEDLERIATSFAGVEKSFAIQAGREIRIAVNSDKLTDADASLLCRDVTKKIESELTYPGQIKVTVIRETREVGIAK